jgi:hypothetical protein
LDNKVNTDDVKRRKGMKRCFIYGMCFFMVMGMVATETRAQQKPMPEAKVMVPHPTQTKVTSCIKQVGLPVKFDDSFLKNNVDNTAVAVNINHVPLFIAGSHLVGETVECYYKSQNGDIPNLVYKYPCKNGKKGGTSYEHSYTCDK